MFVILFINNSRRENASEELDNELDPEEANLYSTDGHEGTGRLTLFTAT